MHLVAARMGEKFFVQVRPQKKDNNFTNRAISEEMTRLGICEEGTQDESRTAERLKKFYEVPPSFVTTLLRTLNDFRQHFVIYHSFYDEEKTRYQPQKGNQLGTKPKKRAMRRSPSRP